MCAVLLVPSIAEKRAAIVWRILLKVMTAVREPAEKFQELTRQEIEEYVYLTLLLELFGLLLNGYVVCCVQ